MAEREFVQGLFDTIARRYDLTNSLLSGFMDKVWRLHTVRLLSEPRFRSILDLCAGTLPLTMELSRYGGKEITALDLSHSMLGAGRRTALAHGREIPELVCGEGERLPFRDESFDGIMVAFGIRNLEDLAAGFGETYRTLRPGGRLVILEFTRPDLPFFSPVYRTYLFHVLPRVAGFVTGDRPAYDYLARTIYSFHDRGELIGLLKNKGFSTVGYRTLTLGVVTIYWAEKS